MLQTEIKKQQRGMGVMPNTVFPEDLSLDPRSHVGQQNLVQLQLRGDLVPFLASKGTHTYIKPTGT